MFKVVLCLLLIVIFFVYMFMNYKEGFDNTTQMPTSTQMPKPTSTSTQMPKPTSTSTQKPKPKPASAQRPDESSRQLPYCDEITTQAPKVECESTFKCNADSGSKLGDKMCCNQRGRLQNLSHICPVDYPKCAGYKCGVSWGKCVREEPPPTTKAPVLHQTPNNCIPRMNPTTTISMLRHNKMTTNAPAPHQGTTTTTQMPYQSTTMEST